MDLKISYRHIESTPAIEEKIQKKATKLKKYFNGKIDVAWICSVESGVHNSEVTVSVPNFQVHASASESNLYKTFDLVLEKLEKQLQKRNEQQKEKIHK